MKFLSLGLLAMAGAALMPTQQQPVFRSAADLVTVDASVRDGNKPVASLTAADFELRDNGVVQHIDAVSYDTLPIDVRMVVDLSGSISADQLARHEAAMRQLQSALTYDDRCEISTFARRMHRVAGRAPAPVSMSLRRPDIDGTSFYDAASLAMITVAEPGRRQLTMMLTDGVDSASFFDEATLDDAARRTDAVVNVITAVDRNLPIPLEQRLRRLVSPTGGEFMTIKRGMDIGPALVKMVADFRQSYVLTYTPANVSRDGWHTITVTVPKGKSFAVRARQGYFGG
jgi:VWFA-related protein